MNKKKISILGISGNLRKGSSASAILETISKLVPHHLQFRICKAIGEIAPFNDSKEILCR